MKINMPVTNKEVMFDESEFMLTKTDLEGVITLANQSFIKVSGFTEAELVGSNHNVVRHPDMPAEAFADLWANLKAGRPWNGLVKNRTKNGDHYWVNANVTPFMENGQVVGYLSVRGKPARAQVDAAEQAYRLFRENKAKGLLIADGKVVKNTVAYRLKNKLLDWNVSRRLGALVAFSVMVVVALVMLGLSALDRADEGMKSIYEDHMKSAEKLQNVSKSLLHIQSQLFSVVGAAETVKADNGSSLVKLNRNVANEVVPRIEKDIATINELWQSYMSGTLTTQEKALAEKANKAKDSFILENVTPAIAVIRKLNAEETMRYVDAAPLQYEASNNALQELIDLQSTDTATEYQSSVTRLSNLRSISFGALAGAIVILIWLGFVLIRSIANPLKNMIDTFAAIANGKLNTPIEAHGKNELSQALFALRSTQTTISANLNVQQQLADQVKDQSTLYENQLTAISNSTGVIEFNMDGTVIAANDIFLKAIGYSRSEAIGRPHSDFVDAAYRGSPEYKAFWEQLNRGEAVTGEFKRICKNGKEVWLQASYNPILCAVGKPYKVVKYATDITEQKLKNADFEGQMTAISKSQGVIEIALDGTVLKANEVYLNMLGYSEKELVGKHVSMVLDPAFAKSAEYAALWGRLVKGGSDAGQYKRIAKSGKEVWIQASYNPINDLYGQPLKIANYTIDITEQKLEAANNAGQIAAINKIQGVIEFDLTGKIMAVNDNFANVTGYTEKEIVGNHHSMFVEPTYRSSAEYKSFWDRLAQGEAQVGQFKRIGKGGKEVWLQASYNPISDMNGRPYKVVKYATDITEQHNSAQVLSDAVEETQAIIESAKGGDLSSRVPLAGKTGAIASLCDGVNALMDQMTEVIVQVREAGETINTAAGEIASGNNDLSSRTEQQASSLEETAASMEELASTVKNNAENAKQANQLAVAASGVAVKGGQVVGQVVNTMSAINQSANKIEDIISVIDGIAFQTNILALNAAVEAARAGEQGRGFAVVAGEVRNLAQRSATAAKEIKELIADSVSKTAEGTTQVENAGKTMQEIVSSVQRVTDIMSEITAASVEQSQGIDQVNSAITSMDEVTQQNAALVEQAAAAAESLVEQAANLIDTVGAFKLNDGASYDVARPAARAVARPTLAKPAFKGGAKSSPRPAPKSATTRLVAKATDSDGDWEEF